MAEYMGEQRNLKTKARLSSKPSERELRNRRLSLKAAEEGIVLLENNGILPIGTGRIALFGAGAEYTIKGGSGSGEVNVRHSVNVLEGLEKAGFTVTTKDWIRRYDAEWKEGKERFIREMRKVLLKPGFDKMGELMSAEYRYPSGDRITEKEIGKSGSRVCLYILSRQSGEGYDRKDEAGSFRLTEEELFNIRLCAEHYPQFVLIINTGAVIDLSPLDEIPGIGAVVYMNQLGMEGGTALANILTGKTTPSGKLAVTWAKRYADYPFASEFGPYAMDADRALYKEGIYVGYRYFDSFGIEPRYPFGYGKSYTDFQIESTGVSVDHRADSSDAESGKTENHNVHVSVDVTNKGVAYAGKETVQIYVSCPQAGQAKEFQRLAAFQKTEEILPGETKFLTLDFSLESLSSYDEENGETYLEAGSYIVRAGDSSRRTKPVAKLLLPEKVVLSRHKNLCASSHKIQEIEMSSKEQKLSASPEIRKDAAGKVQGKAELPEFVIDPKSFETVQYDYSETKETFSKRTEKYLDWFTQNDMVKFCAGTGLFGEKKGFQTPGSVGHTTTEYLNWRIPNIEMCDGPAGVRLQTRSTIDKKGNIKAVDAALSVYDYLPGFIRRFLLGDPEKDTVLYQFVTGFPVAAALAQTWNAELVRRVGRAVSEEMTEYGVACWLAPALNIVRNPLCGRNFEYYSEDPLISGEMAAAVTQGVQETAGNSVTIKHFAANNQEDNRYSVSSEVDERTLREIYLKGFEIVVRKAAPKAVMSAYNKINGVYCANHKELCTDILRKEWGFDGIIMTDWLSTGGKRADASLCAPSGVDLIMPGGKGVIRALKKAYKNQKLSESDLRRSCGRVLEWILSSRQNG